MRRTRNPNKRAKRRSRKFRGGQSMAEVKETILKLKQDLVNIIPKLLPYFGKSANKFDKYQYAINRYMKGDNHEIKSMMDNEMGWMGKLTGSTTLNRFTKKIDRFKIRHSPIEYREYTIVNMYGLVADAMRDTKGFTIPTDLYTTDMMNFIKITAEKYFLKRNTEPFIKGGDTPDTNTRSPVTLTDQLNPVLDQAETTLLDNSDISVDETQIMDDIQMWDTYYNDGYTRISNEQIRYLRPKWEHIKEHAKNLNASGNGQMTGGADPIMQGIGFMVGCLILGGIGLIVVIIKGIIEGGAIINKLVYSIEFIITYFTSSKSPNGSSKSSNNPSRRVVIKTREELDRRLYWNSIIPVNNINDWDVSAITDMSNLFANMTNFNRDISNWDVSNVKNMRGMFYNCSNFNQDISNWNVSNVTNMSYMFYYCESFNQPLANWERHDDPDNQSTVSKVTKMSSMFSGCYIFNKNISNWNVSNVTDMVSMFNRCREFNQPLANWERHDDPNNQSTVSKVTDMSSMFNECGKFNQDINNWNVSNVTNMGSMFMYCRTFNKPLANWNVSKVTNMDHMFFWCELFNQPLANWERWGYGLDSSTVYNVKNMEQMFSGCEWFNKDYNFFNKDKVNNDINNWKINPENKINGMFKNDLYGRIYPTWYKK
jgi:surface protein